jgi:CPA2 family monovalent cation:H+ antiporter-2
MVFFLSIGLLVDLAYMWDNLLFVLTLVAFIAVFKTLLNIFVLRLLGETWPRAFLCGALLAQIGEFSFIMAALGVGVHAVSEELYRTIVAVTVLSLVVSPLWLEASRRLHRIILLGITSGRETVRLTVGHAPFNLFRTNVRSNDAMVDMASNATRWMGDIMPRGRRGLDGRTAERTPGLGMPGRRPTPRR